MWKTTHTNLSVSGVLNPLLDNYLAGRENTKSLYNYYPDLNGFREALQEQPYDKLDREYLYSVLKAQSLQVNNFSTESNKNLELLKAKNCFTITTGHQLCLFTGPLYFIYKVISCIRLCEELKRSFPDSDFVPVYWMASEDHDFEEVNHFHLFGKKLIWETDQKGPVGHFSTRELNTTFLQFKELAGNMPNAPELVQLFNEAYLQHNNLSAATRFLVNAIFGKYGIVTVDPMDKDLKSLFKDIILDDLFTQTAFQKVTETNSKLSELGYQVQVTPRPINSFYTEPGLRSRIEKVNGTYKVLGTDLTFTEKEIQILLNRHPEKFSPNVVLRPLYQQTILPNLAYVGGPGELSYWLQYKSMFDHYKTFLPVLVPRSFVSVFEKPVSEKLRKLSFSVEDVFLTEQEMISRFMIRSEITFEAEQEKEKLKQIYDELTAKASGIDKTLGNSVSAELQKALNGIQNLEAKITRAIKLRSETEINQIKSVKQKLFPEGLPQERFDNFSVFYLKHGKQFIELLHKELQPLVFKQYLFEEMD